MDYILCLPWQNHWVFKLTGKMFGFSGMFWQGVRSGNNINVYIILTKCCFQSICQQLWLLATDSSYVVFVF